MSRLLFALGLLSIPALSLAQVTTATIFGTVTDPSGGAVGQASVMASNELTGGAWNTSSNGGGEFTFTFLPVGRYSIIIRAAGFKEDRHTGLELTAGKELRLRFALALGSQTESVTVSAEVPLLNTVNAEQDLAVNALRVMELPTANRDWSSLIQLGAGMIVTNGAVSMNGLPPGGFRFTIDGVDGGANGESASMATYGNYNYIKGVSTEAVREVNVVAGIAPAETGPTMSGNVNVITKSGTNEFHGSLFENNRLEDFAARDQFLATRPPLVFNQFGGSLGGRIIRNKLFFFGVFEGYRQRAFSSVNGNVPTTEFRQQIISALPPAKAFFDTFPLPNTPYAPGAVTGFFQGADSRGDRDNHWSMRGDYQVSSGNLLTLRYTHDTPFRREPRVSPANARTRDGITHQGVVSFVHSAAAWSAETRFGYNRAEVLRLDHIYDLGISAITGSLGFSNTGETMHQFGSNSSYEQVVALNRGRHSIKFGGMFQIYKSGRINITVPEFQFANAADLMANIPSQVTISFGVNKYNLYNWINGYFVQDDFRLSSNVMLSMGLRYDHFSVARESSGRLFNRTGPFGIGPFTDPDSVYKGNWLNFSPRLGLAWTVNPKTVVRVGAGKFTSPHNAFGGPVELIQNAIDEPNRVIFSRAEAQRFGIRYPTTNAAILPLVKGGGGPISGTVIGQNFPEPYSLQWTFSISRELSKTMSLESAYAGNHAVHANVVRQFNKVDPLTGQRAFPAYSEYRYYDGSESVHYNGWQNTFRKRLSSDFQISAVYVWANTISYTNAADLSLPNPPQNTDNIRGDRGPSPFDVRHHFLTDFLYELPFQRLARAKSRVGKLLLGGWQFAGIYSAETGTPITVTQSTTHASSRPDYLGGSAYTTDSISTLQYINRAAFVRVPIGASGAPVRPGNVGRGSLRAPGFWNVDLALSKNFQLGERYRLQIRGDMFNALNHTNFAGITTEITSGSFGRFTSTRGPRTVQFNARLTF